MKDTKRTIFGYSWEDIQARQNKTYQPKPLAYTPPALANDSDYAALEQAGGIKALTDAGMMGVVDRLSRSPIAHCDACGRKECAPWHVCRYNNAKLGTDKSFLITFNTYTEESIESGDSEDGGYDGIENCAIDEFDDDGVTAIDKAIHFLTRDHCVQPSSSSFHEGLYYTDTDNDVDYRTGEQTQHAYHPINFTVDEQRAIFDAVK